MKESWYPTQEELHELLDYNSETGVFVWKRRPVHLFRESRWRERNCKIWNTGNAGKPAGFFDGRYISIGIKGKQYSAHRLAWIYVYGDIGNDEIDHIHWDRTDNRIAELKRVDRVGNQLNMYRKGNNTSGVVGVSYDKTRMKWLAHITVNKNMENLGRYEKFSDAVSARYDAEIKYGYVNFLPNSTAKQYLLQT